MIIKHFRKMRPADDGADLGGDRGDDFTPTDDDAQPTAAEIAAAAKEIADKAAADKLAAGGTDELEEELTDEEVAAAAAAKPGEKKPVNPNARIPVARHKEILQKEREQREELEKRLQRYEGGQRVANTNAEIAAAEGKLLTLEEKYNKELVDGDAAKATVTMREVRSLERDIAGAKSDMAIAAAEARAYERVRYDTTVERIEAAYPMLNVDHEDYDKDMEVEVMDLKAAYQSRGLTPAQALQKAAKTLLGAETSKQTAAVAVTARVDPEAVAKQVAADRKKAAVKKAVDAAGKQPPISNGVGSAADAAGGSIDAKAAMRLPYDEFAKLDDAALAKLRGDVL